MSPVVDDAYLDEVRARPESGHGMRNLNREIDDGLEADLRAGMRGYHYAWNFCGLLWYDAHEGRFYEAAFCYHVIAAVVGAADLATLMHEASEMFGWE
jgi:hypothetical protein